MGERKWLDKSVNQRVSWGNLVSLVVIILVMFSVFFYLFVASMSRDLFWLW